MKLKDGVLLFTASWCTGCKVVKPIFQEIALKNEDINFEIIDVVKNSKLASYLSIMSIPNLLIIKNNKVVHQIIGSFDTKRLNKEIKILKKG
jgi:thioredoxin 1